MGLVTGDDGGLVAVHGLAIFAWDAEDEAGRRLAAVQLARLRAVTETLQQWYSGRPKAEVVAGDHQPPPERLRQRRDRFVQHRQVIGGGVGPGRAAAQHLGQRSAVLPL